MEIGIAFPKIIPVGRSDRIVEWAEHADDGPFSSLALIDRLVYGTHEPLIVLTAAAAVTQRIRLMPTVLISPLRNTAVLAKQVASVDAISGGRFVLGVGVGSRADDFAATGTPMKGRGKVLERQIETMRRIWAGGDAADGAGPIGPRPGRPGGPEILIGGRSAAALERTAAQERPQQLRSEEGDGLAVVFGSHLIGHVFAPFARKEGIAEAPGPTRRRGLVGRG